jgi:hypothetical protein
LARFETYVCTNLALQVLLIVFLGASSAMFLLVSARGADTAVGFEGPGITLFTTFRMMILGDFDTAEFVVGGDANQWVIRVVFVLTMVLVLIILLNLLIALLSDSYEKIQDRAYIEFQLARGRIVLAQEALFFESQFNDPALFPRYVHVLVEQGKNIPKVQPDEWQGVLGKLVSDMAGVKTELKGQVDKAADATKEQMTAMSAKMDSLEEKLSLLLTHIVPKIPIVTDGDDAEPDTVSKPRA